MNIIIDSDQQKLNMWGKSSLPIANNQARVSVSGPHFGLVATAVNPGALRPAQVTVPSSSTRQ